MSYIKIEYIREIRFCKQFSRGLPMRLTLFVVALLLCWPGMSHAVEKKEIHALIWSNFIDQPLFDKFEKETGIKITVDPIDSNEQMMAKLQAGAAYDVASASSYYVEQVKAAGLMGNVDFSKELANWKNVSSFARDPDYDPGHATVPNSFGTVGLVVNRDLYKRPMKTWMDFFKPASELNGKNCQRRRPECRIHGRLRRARQAAVR